MGLSPLLRATVHQDLYVAALNAAYANGVRLYDQDFSLERDVQIDDKIRRDPIIKQAMEDRFHSLVGTWTIEPVSQRDPDVLVASLIEDLIQRMSDFEMTRYRLANAVIDSNAHEFIFGSRKVIPIGPDGTTAEWWVPSRTRNMDYRRFRWQPTHAEDGTLSAVQNVYSPRLGAWVVPTDDWSRQHLSVTYENQESRLGYGRGLREALYHWYWAKGHVFQYGLSGLERWAEGWVVAKVDTKQWGAAGDQDTEQLKEDYLRVIRQHKNSYNATVIDREDDMMDLSASSGKNNDLIIKFLDYLDQSITRLITGSLLPAGGGPTAGQGSLARSEVEEQSSTRLIQFDRKILDNALTRDLVQIVWVMNQEAFAALGLGDAQCPRFKTVNQKLDDPNENATLIKTVLDAGMPVLKEEAYTKVGLTMPGPEDDVIEPQQPLDPALAGAGVGGGVGA